jgi:CSLREA domain-containing protein
MRHHRIVTLSVLVIFSVLALLNRSELRAWQALSPTPTVLSTSFPTATETPQPTPLPVRPTVTPTASGQILVVNKLVDTDDGKCDPQDCSLREAIAGATWGATITFVPGTKGTIALTKPLIIDKNLTISGPGPKSSALILSGEGKTHVMESSAALSINTLTIANGYTPNGVGGISTGGVLIVTNSTFLNNGGAHAGAILNMGQLTVNGSLFQGNGGNGSGAIGNYGTVTITNSTFDDNTAAGADVLWNNGTAIFINSTLRGRKGGSDILEGEKITLKGSIIDSSSDPELRGCGSPVIDGGFNLQFPRNDCGPGIVVGDPKLGALRDNGGPTLTIELMTGSAALGKIPRANCPDKDQRGTIRPTNTACNIGAFQQ